ncbi:reticulon-3 isoform X2 [Cavia porcellus]|uniref:reticulon-3 isoform X2 n=1 Tax=Cavia porcellus TaxID=10141 RepID=UPI000661EE2A|nr:reticulon-3 isoform X2 [Cavia porcellus]
MAESSAVTQFPSVSSSSSGAEPSAPGGGGGSPGACPALGAKSCGSSCADSFVSSYSSQPVSIFSTSQALHGEKSEVLGSQSVISQEGEDPLALLDTNKMEKLQGTSQDRADTPVSPAAGVPYSHPSAPTSTPDHSAFLSNEAGRVEGQVSKDQESKNPDEVPCRDKTALDACNGFTLLTAQETPAKQSKAEGVHTHSLSWSEVSDGGTVEKESPESPFEVIADKAAFDREFSNSLKESTSELAGWAGHGDRESPTDMLEKNDKLFPLRSKEVGRYPTSALLTRQFSHTTAALEEVSRCVSDMRNFTNEILTWDLVPQVKQQAEKSDYATKSAALNRNDYPSEIPVVNLKTNTHYKIPVCSINGSTAVSKSPGNWVKDSLPQENSVIQKQTRDRLSPTREVSVKGVQGNPQKQGNMLSELPGSPCGADAVKVILSDDHLRDEINWQNPALGEVAEADSSGESDDTVTEDITADRSFETNKILARNPVSTPDAVVKTDQREIKELPSYKTENKTSENSKEPVSDSEMPQVQPDILGRSPVGKAVCSQIPHTDVISEDRKQPGTMSEAAPEKLITADNPQLPSAAPPNAFNEAEFSLNLEASANSESLHGKHVKDIDESSPEDLIAAITETREERTIEREEGAVCEAVSEKMTDCKNTLSMGESGGSQVKDIKGEYIEQSQETRGSKILGVFPTQGPVASFDLEQEQLTIRALKELGERQATKSAAAQEEESPSKERLTFAPESWPQRSYDVLGHTAVKIGSDLGLSKKPTVFKETRVDIIPSLSKTDLVNKHVLARLLTDFSVHDLIFWRDVKKTGFVFGTTLIVLLSLAAFSVISVVSYLILALLSVTISFRVYKSVIQAVQKSEEGHPFKAYLDLDITLSSEAFHNYVNAAMVHVNRALKLIIRLFLVEDLVDSLKLAVFMWLMTYVGAVFNGITLLILGELLVFSVPIVYEKYKTQIDHYIGIARDQTKSIVEKIQAKLPGIAKKKAE